jgi:hypothetical protein
MTQTTPKTEPKPARKWTRRTVPELSPFEVEQHALANKAMSTIHAPC